MRKELLHKVNLKSIYPKTPISNSSQTQTLREEFKNRVAYIKFP